MVCSFGHGYAGQQDYPAIGVGDWLTVAANVPEAGYRKTDFYRRDYNVAEIQWDSRLELWLPPFKGRFSWGPYIKAAGIAQSATMAYPNGWLGGPGGGFQVYPFSSTRFRTPTSKVGAVFGPLRLFSEYNRINFWGSENSWRPRSQIRAGIEYWKAVNVNDPAVFWWAELWTGLYWQSSNEFTAHYDSVVFANAWRSGIRKPRSGLISLVTPYLAIISSRTKYNRTGTQDCGFQPTADNPQNPCNFYWENRLLVGGGFRFAPRLPKASLSRQAWLSRLVVYGEYLNTAAYYGPHVPSSVPRFDVSVGLSASVGDWYSRR
ncbi:MAG: hypothetical protein ACJ746_25090 [Bryobacteraceae bacterium]